MSSGRTLGRALLLATALTALALPGSAAAATINVESDLDTNPAADGFCTLREAVFVANTNEPTGGRGMGNLGCEADTAGHDTIVLTANHVYAVSQAFAIEDGNVWSDLDISGPTTITTAGGMATIQGNGTDPQPTDRDRVLHVLPTAGGVRLERVRIQGGWVNSGVGGGGILSDAPLTIIDSEITGNRVQVNQTNTQGGGLFVRGPLGSLTMRGSTVAGNVGQVVGAPGCVPCIQTVGGGLSVDGAGASADITNSTISQNSAIGNNAVGPGFAGGAFLAQVPATLTNTTITANTATAGGALVGGVQLGSATLSGNVIAGNISDNPQAVDCFGFPESDGGNVIGNRGTSEYCVVTGPGDLVGTPADPVLANLGTLLPNGGLTRTHLPNADSPAINRGGSCPATDQRGLFRYIALPCDSGSVEVGATATPPPSPTPPPATQGAPTGQRADALKKCKKKKGKKKKKKCRKKANQLPL